MLDLVINGIMYGLAVILAGFVIGFSLRRVIECFKEKHYIFCGLFISIIIAGVSMIVLATAYPLN
jgi:F0F1-type ATP synthase membrane subunit c/vacuolar-type H+-ATPase subunit K